jgi:hypothetical protein
MGLSGPHHGRRRGGGGVRFYGYGETPWWYGPPLYQYVETSMCKLHDNRCGPDCPARIKVRKRVPITGEPDGGGIFGRDASASDSYVMGDDRVMGDDCGVRSNYGVLGRQRRPFGTLSRQRARFGSLNSSSLGDAGVGQNYGVLGRQRRPYGTLSRQRSQYGTLNTSSLGAEPADGARVAKIGLGLLAIGVVALLLKTTVGGGAAARRAVSSLTAAQRARLAELRARAEERAAARAAMPALPPWSGR